MVGNDVTSCDIGTSSADVTSAGRVYQQCKIYLYAARRVYRLCDYAYETYGMLCGAVSAYSIPRNKDMYPTASVGVAHC